jgi:hypothetical protein
LRTTELQNYWLSLIIIYYLINQLNDERAGGRTLTFTTVDTKARWWTLSEFHSPHLLKIYFSDYILNRFEYISSVFQVGPFHIPLSNTLHPLLVSLIQAIYQVTVIS